MQSPQSDGQGVDGPLAGITVIEIGQYVGRPVRWGGVRGVPEAPGELGEANHLVRKGTHRTEETR